MTDGCVICSDDLRDAADLLLLRGHDYTVIARRLKRPPEWAEALEAHLYAKHVSGPTKENYTILLVDYLQATNKMLKRELEKRDKQQRTAIINLAHRATQWGLQGYMRMEGLYAPAGTKKISGDVIEALNALAQGNPDAVKRIADARKKQTPVLIEAKRVEEDAGNSANAGQNGSR